MTIHPARESLWYSSGDVIVSFRDVGVCVIGKLVFDSKKGIHFIEI